MLVESCSLQRLISICALLCSLVLAASTVRAAEPVQIKVEGLTGKELANVEASLTLPAGLVREGKVDELWLGRFKGQIPDKVRDALSPFGYYDPAVEVTTDGQREGFYLLRIKVEPGPPVRVTRVDVQVRGPGAEKGDLNKLVSAFPLHAGDRLRQDLYEEAKAGLQGKAVSAGFLDADYSVHEIRVAPSQLTAEIDLVLQTGEHYRFGPVTYSGAPQFPDRFLHRHVTFKPGDIFSQAQLAQTQLNFMNADRFSEVTIDADKSKAKDHSVPIEVKLVPSATKRLRIGGGYGTDTGVRGALTYTDVDALSRGHRLDAQLTASEYIQGVAAAYTIPSTTDIDSFYALLGNLQNEYLSDYHTQKVSVELQRAKRFGIGRVGTFYVQVQKENSVAGDQITNAFLVMPGVRLTGRTYDNLTRPTKGYRYLMELRGTDQALGSDTGFIQFLANGDVTVPLPWRLSLLGRAQFGATTQNQGAADLPITVRFFSGGDRSVRGYAYQSLGPKDDNGDVVGGKHLLAGSIELERAIGKNWGIAAFYDVGNAFNNFSQMDLAQSVGLGGRYYTPVGPIRLDIARQIAMSNPGFRIHFTIGVEL
jgi:translocation and assembly module TamA